MQVLENEAVTSRFHAAYDKLNEALDDVPYDELGVSVEVQEQVSLHRLSSLMALQSPSEQVRGFRFTELREMQPTE